MNDRETRTPRGAGRRRPYLGRGNSGNRGARAWFSRWSRSLVGANSFDAFKGGAQGWVTQVGAFPARYSLHALALCLGAGAIFWVNGAQQGRPAEELLVGDVAAVASAAPLETPASPAPIPTVEPTPVVSAQIAKPFQYLVEPGDTLRSIAEYFGVSVQTLIWNNQFRDPDVLRTGQELVVLPTSGVLHTVKAGETLLQLAERYNVGVSELARQNGIDNPDTILEGTRLVVPGGQPLVERSVRAPARTAQVAAGPQLVAMAELSPLPPSGQPGEARAFQSETASVPKPGTVEYEVKPGDTLRVLTQLFGVDMQTILAFNEIADADLISVGTKLRIPPVSGLKHEVKQGETLADIARLYEVDMGPILDFNDLPDPDLIRMEMKLIVPGAKTPKPAPPPPAPVAPAVAGAARPALAAAPKPAPARPAPPPAVTGSGAAIVQNAMAFRGYPYVFGGTSPAGFDCSGFVWYVYNRSGNPISRAMWGQLNAGPRIAREHLQPGDIVFFANTYMPGLSHNGIYVGGGQFVHASDPSTGVVVSSMSSSYWASRYVGASRP